MPDAKAKNHLISSIALSIKMHHAVIVVAYPQCSCEELPI